MQRSTVILFLVVLVAGGVPDPDGQGPRPERARILVEEYRLRNGLRVILSDDAASP